MFQIKDNRICTLESKNDSNQFFDQETQKQKLLNLFSLVKMSFAPNKYSEGSMLSVSRKKQALWNVVEPGDPYDIRKSMIAKIPFDKKTFMGDHLELVCLFQAAQIERLCEFLEDFKLRYRQIQRKQLDRHSYEIQIMELTHKLADEAIFREENDKLRQFIKNLSVNKHDMEDSIKTKYEKLLVHAKAFEQQNAKLKNLNEGLTTQIFSFEAKLEALKKSKQTEIDEIYMKMSQQSDYSSQLQLSSLKTQYESQVQRLELQNKRLKQSNDEKLRQIEGWQLKYKICEQQLFKTSPTVDLSKYEKKIYDYENRFVIFGQQIDRLNLVIKEISQKYQHSQKVSHDYQAKYQMLNKETLSSKSQISKQQGANQQLMIKIHELEIQNTNLKESGQFSIQNQLKLKQANEQITHLKAQLKKQLQNSSILMGEVQRYQYEENRMRITEKELQQYRQSAQNNNLKLRIAQQQTQIKLMQQQIHQLKQQLSLKAQLQNINHSIELQNKNLQTRLADNQRNLQLTVQQYQMRINQKVSQYETRIENINKTKGYQYESRAASLQSQVQRMSETLKRKTEELNSYQRQVRQLEYTITSKYELQNSRRIQNYENVIQTLKKDQQQTFARLRELQPLQRRISQYQNTSIITAQEIERLTQNLRAKDNQLETLRRLIKQQEVTILQKYEIDTSKKITHYQNTVNSLQRENNELKRNLKEMENKVALLSQEIERLSSNLRDFQLRANQTEQEVERMQRIARDKELNISQKYELELNHRTNSFQSSIRNLQRENDELRRRLMELQNLGRRVLQYENQLRLSGQEIERLNNIFTLKQQQAIHLQQNNRSLIREFQQLGHKYNDLQINVKNKYEVQMVRTVGSLQQNISILKRQNDELKKIIQEHEMRNKKQSNDLEVINSSMRNLVQQNDTLKRQIIDVENSYKAKFDTQVVNNYKAYENTINEFKRELEGMIRENTELKKVIQNIEQSIHHISQQKEELKLKIHQDSIEASTKVNDYEKRASQLQLDNQVLRRNILELQAMIKDKYEIQASRKISVLDQNLANSKWENQELRRRLDLTSRELDELRKVSLTMQRDNEQLAKRLIEYGDINKKVIEYENKISILSQEMERTSIALRSRIDDISRADAFINQLTTKLQVNEKNLAQSQSSVQQYEFEMKNRINNFEQKLTILHQQNNELKKRLNGMEEMNRKMSEYQNKIKLLNQQLQRATQNYKIQLEKSTQLENTLRNVSGENQNLRRAIVEIQNNLTQKYEVQMTKTIRNLQMNAENLLKQNNQLKKVISESEQAISNQNANIQKLNSNLKSLLEENNSLKRQLQELQHTFSQNTQKLSIEVKRDHSLYEQNISNLKRQNDDLKKYIQEISSKFDYQMNTWSQKYALLQRQNQDLTRNLQQLSLRYESETKSRGNIEINLSSIARQNDELKKKQSEFQIQIDKLIRKLNQTLAQNQEIKRKTRESENQIIQRIHTQNAQQINFLKQQNSQIQNQLYLIQKENDELVRKLSDFGGESSRKLIGVEEDLKRARLQIQRLNGRIRQYEISIRQINGEKQILIRRTKDTQFSITQKFESQIRTKSMSYEQTITSLKRQIDDLELKMRMSLQQKERALHESSSRMNLQLQSKIALISQEVQRLNQVILKKTDDGQKMLQQIERLNNTLRMKLQESKQWETEVSRLKSSTQSEFNQLQYSYSIVSKENQNYKKHLIEYENSIKKLYAEFERFQNIINDLKKQREQLFEKNYALSTEIDRILNENRELETQVQDVRLRLTDESSLHKRINEHMALMVILFAEIQSLRRRVKEKEKQVQDVRRSSIAPFKLSKSRPKLQSM